MSSPVPKSKLAGGQCLIIIGTEGVEAQAVAAIHTVRGIGYMLDTPEKAVETTLEQVT